MGKIGTPSPNSERIVSAFNLFVENATVANLWELDCLGINDPAENKTRQELKEAAIDRFENTVTIDDDGRYEVSLPWLPGHPPLPTNRKLVEKRLENTVKRLRADGLLEEYQNIMREWLKEQIIEEVLPNDVSSTEHYLPHRAVVKSSSQTTKVRPVFDASAKEKYGVSLNDCLDKGVNLIESLPSVLTRFRMKRIGIISDIRRAFLQIAVTPSDRDYLRFLWWEDGDKDRLKIYRHRRVVFGVSASPFLLGATLAHHLGKAPEHLKCTANRLLDSLYVDNCATSVNDESELQVFVQEAVEVLKSAKFELHGWCFNSPSNIVGVPVLHTEGQADSVPVLGLLWNVTQDLLGIDTPVCANWKTERVTKRVILSVAHRVFDPIGFTCPTMLQPKLLLQDTCKLKLGWDDELPEDIGDTFRFWCEQLLSLKDVAIPRSLDLGGRQQDAQIHVFCDASKRAYATCIFIRIEMGTEVFVHLVQAKARVAPMKPVSIPRLELMACCIGARLAAVVQEDLRAVMPVVYWTDSMNALCWIQREEPWGTFVWNRVREIRALSGRHNWHHIPGGSNPADLPSRGCTVARLIETRWWEGPTWLRLPADKWPQSKELPNESEICQELRKTAVSVLTATTKMPVDFLRFSSFRKLLRVMGWIHRFIGNCNGTKTKSTGELSQKDLEQAETILVRLIQSESFRGPGDDKIRALRPFEDECGVIRAKTSVVMRTDTRSFRYPVILPSEHVVVKLLILDQHVELCHAGVQILMVVLRERFWILKSRKTIRQVVASCKRCRRFTVKPFTMDSVPLPADRVNDASVFQTTGVDLMGPLFLKGGQKAWTVLFTCGVYRALHLELITSMSTEAFIGALRRFVARRGRPSTIYSDNGTNFVGADNVFRQCDWNAIQSYATVRRINWKFNPPSAPWWGGWWERLVRMVKLLLRRILGRACLQYEELLTILCDCEGVINSRPLTYVSEDVDDLQPLTPAMFIRDTPSVEVPDIDVIDKSALNRRARYRQRLRADLRRRFRLEYLGHLRQQGLKSGNATVRVGDVVLLENESPRRLDWRLARVLETYPGRDGQVRVVRVKTNTGVLIRPVQKLYPLEVDNGAVCIDQSPKASAKAKPVSNQDKIKPPNSGSDMATRSGRKVKPPERLMYA